MAKEKRQLYFEMNNLVSESLKKDKAFRPLADKVTKYISTDAGRHCFLWEDVSPEEVDAFGNYMYHNFSVGQYQLVYNHSDNNTLYYGCLKTSQLEVNLSMKGEHG